MSWDEVAEQIQEINAKLDEILKAIEAGGGAKAGDHASQMSIQTPEDE